jgi:hypothetical protein
MDAAMALAEPPELGDMTEPTAQQARMLYHVLVQVLKGKAKKLAMASEEGNGFKLWVALCREYESSVPGRHQSMLMALLKPLRWEHAKAADFEPLLLEWELEVQRYERQTGKSFDDDNRVATVLQWAPEELRLSLMTGDAGNRATYARARSALLTVMKSTLRFSGSGLPLSSDPMQVDQLRFKGGKGGKDHTKHGDGGKGTKGHTEHGDGGKGDKDITEHVDVNTGGTDHTEHGDGGKGTKDHTEHGDGGKGGKDHTEHGKDGKENKWPAIWREFGLLLKEGYYASAEHRELLLPLLRFLPGGCDGAEVALEGASVEALAAPSICQERARHLAMRPKLVLVAYSSRQASKGLT